MQRSAARRKPLEPSVGDTSIRPRGDSEDIQRDDSAQISRLRRELLMEHAEHGLRKLLYEAQSLRPSPAQRLLVDDIKKKLIATPKQLQRTNRRILLVFGGAAVATVIVLGTFLIPNRCEGILNNPSWEYAGNVMADPTSWSDVFSDIDSSTEQMSTAIDLVESCRSEAKQGSSARKAADEKLVAMTSRNETLGLASAFAKDASQSEFDERVRQDYDWPDSDLAMAFLTYYIQQNADGENQEHFIGINELRKLTWKLENESERLLLQNQLKLLVSSENPWCEIGYEFLFAEDRPEEVFDTISKLARLDKSEVLWELWVENSLLERLAQISASHGYSRKLMRSLSRLYEEDRRRFLIHIGIEHLANSASSDSFENQLQSADREVLKTFFEHWVQLQPVDDTPDVESMKTVIESSDEFGRWFFQTFDGELDSSSGLLQLRTLNHR